MASRTIIAAAIGCLAASGVLAQDASIFKLSGFGTLAATHFSRDDIDFAGGPAVQNGAGRTRSTSFGTDSKAGLQLQATPLANLTFTVQALAKETPRNDWNPSIDWANVKYSFNENVALRVGRIGHPFFMISDYRQVNYANLPLRPPIEIYSLVPLNSSDVVEGLFKLNAGPGQFNVQTGFGRIRSDTIPSSSARDHDKAKVRDLAYINAFYEVGPWNLRAGYTQGELSYDALAPRVGIFDVLSRFGATGARLRSDWEIKDVKSSFTGFGATYDQGNVVASAEYVMLRAGNAYNGSDAWSLIGGYRIGKFTPYLAYASSRTANRIRVRGVATALAPLIPHPNPAVRAGMAAALQGGIQQFADASLTDQSTASIGVRWDVYKNLAIKAQYDHIRVKDPSPSGFLINPGADYREGAGGNVIAVSLDFVF